MTMPPHPLDDVARNLAESATRRRTLRAGVVTALGLLLAPPALRRVAARRRCKELGRQCNNDDACCAGKCSPKRICHCYHWQVRCDDRPCCPKDRPNCCR
jgi:hypothetical protein